MAESIHERDIRGMGTGSAGTIMPDMEEQVDDTGHGDGYIVIVYDNDHNTVPEVISILQQATRCTRDEAEMETWEVHHLGKSVVHHSGKDECERAADIIRTIGIRVEVREE